MKKIDLQKMTISKLNRDQCSKVFGGDETEDFNCNGKTNVFVKICPPES